MSANLATTWVEIDRARRAEVLIAEARALLEPEPVAPMNGEIVSLDIHRHPADLYVDRLPRAKPGPSTRPWAERFGRAFDLFFASALLLVFSPVILIVSIVLWRSGGGLFFGHSRIGRRGEYFQCLKFRTMKADAESRLKAILETDPDACAEWECDHKLKNDPRITRLGRVLRQTSLDEIPQLFNVFRGEMSLVGPRPIVLEEVTKYGSHFAQLVSVRPGITGLWQVSGRNDITYRRRKALDILYVRKKSLGFDLKILFRTISVMLYRCGAY
jgi:lipopolysaccharide/colanic/teichoic acid biosynthesis glycosyltransferase